MDSGKQSGSGSDKSKNKKKPQKPASSQPSTSDFPPDIEWSPEDEASGLVPFVQAAAARTRDSSEDKTTVVCEALYAADPEGVARAVKFMTGCEPDDDEQGIAQELKHVLQTIAPHGLFEDEPWYTTPLASTPSIGRGVSNEIPVETPGSENQTSEGTTLTGEEADERWYRGQETELDPSIQHALANTFSSREWKDEWTKPEHLEGFLKDHLAPFFTKEDIDSLPWDRLTDFGKIHMYSFLMQSRHDETWHLNSPNSDWNIRLDDEAESAEALLLAVTAVPLVNEARLVQEFGYPDAVTARIDLTIELQFAYESLGISPPQDLHEWSLLQHANEYRDVLANVFIPYYSKEMDAEAYSKSLDFAAGYEDIAHSDPETMIARLEGNKQNSPLELVFFVASFFIEPLDWGLTIRDMISAAEDGDWEEAVLLGLVGLAPGALGRFVKRGKADEVLDAARVSQISSPVGKVPDPYQRPGSDYVSAGNYTLDSSTSSNARKLGRQMDNAVEVDPQRFEKRLLVSTGGKTPHRHHMVPSGDRAAREARLLLLEEGIDPNSAYNGVVLKPDIHYFVHKYDNRIYGEVVNNAVLRLAGDPLEMDMFLDKLADRLMRLNKFSIDDPKFVDEVTEIFDWIDEYP